MLSKSIDIFLVLLYLSFAVVQYNDPDPIFWTLIYVYPTALCLMGFFKKYNKMVLLITAVVYTIGFLYQLPKDPIIIEQPLFILSETMTAAFPVIEEAREALGLLICSGGMFYNYRRAVKHKKEEQFNLESTFA